MALSLAAPPSSVCRLDVGEPEFDDDAGAELADAAGAELADEGEDADDEDELLHPAASAARASTVPAVTICLSFTGLLPFRIESERDS
jgi:hypothetical protein